MTLALPSKPLSRTAFWLDCHSVWWRAHYQTEDGRRVTARARSPTRPNNGCREILKITKPGTSKRLFSESSSLQSTSQRQCAGWTKNSTTSWPGLSISFPLASELMASGAPVVLARDYNVVPTRREAKEVILAE